jgi:monovalent cation:H+ antiporter, CPA1 family
MFTHLRRLLVLFLLLSLSACAAPPLLFPQVSTGHAPGSLVQVEEIIVVLLLIAALVSLVTQRLRIPYTVGLVLVGFALTIFEGFPAVNITPELILAILVPPLVFEASFVLDYADLRRELRLILLLAIPGVILTTLLVGGMVAFGSGIALPYALIFGALISATDPVSVVALFRSLGAPKRLQVLLEGESLLNDGTAIVLFNLMIAAALTGGFNIGQSVVQFIAVSGGGIVVGIVIGMVFSTWIGRINNALVETTLTTVIAYGSYIIAEFVFGVSGVLAVVAAGLISGQIGPRGMSPTTRIVVFNFWEYVAFLANSFVFLIIGLETDYRMLFQNLPAIFWAIVAVLVSRAVIVYGLSSLRRDIPVQWKNILFWGGLRGAISLALALSLAVDLPHREQLQAMAFGVVLFTLLVEGLTMQPLIKHSAVIISSTLHDEYDLQHARAVAMRAALSRIHKMHNDGVISDFTLLRLRPLLESNLAALTEKVQASLEAQPVLYEEELADAWVETLRARRNALTGLYHNNIITEEIYTQLVAEVDFLITDPETGWAEFTQQIEKS